MVCHGDTALITEMRFNNGGLIGVAALPCIVAWRKFRETVGNHLTKSRLVAVEGRLQIRSYEAQDGTKRRVAEVVADSVQFLDFPKDKVGVSTSTMPEDAPELPDDLPF